MTNQHDWNYERKRTRDRLITCIYTNLPSWPYLTSFTVFLKSNLN